MAGKGWKEVLQGMRTGQLRWFIVFMLFLSTVLNYIDRQLLSILAPTMKTSLGFGDWEYSLVVTAFTWATVIALLLAGPFVERIGTRKAFILFISIWSLSSALHAFLPSGTVKIGASAVSAGFLALIVLRMILAFGEAGNWPCSGKSVAEWFPTKERGLAMGFFNSGVSVGAILAPAVVWFAGKLIYGIADKLDPNVAEKLIANNWRAAFLITPFLVIGWIVAWLYLYYPPAQHPRITPGERDLIERDQIKGKKAAFWEVAVKPQFWGLFISRALASPVWFFIAYWIANYLDKRFHFNWTKIAAVAWIPFATADVGNIVGGWWSGRLIAKGTRPIKSRIIVMGIGAVGMTVSFLIVWANSAAIAVTLISFLTFAWGLWVSNMLGLVSDSFPKNEVATVMSWTGVGQQGGTMFFMPFIGWWLSHHQGNYTLIFVIAALLPLMSFVFTMWLNWEREHAPEAAKI